MKLKLTAIAAALFCGSAFAQTGTVQRDVNQQERIEQGLKSGQLTTREAARLEREEAKVERDQARALRDGTLSPAEKARLAREQNKVSRDIYREKHDAQTGDPKSPSSQRMQADVQRDVNQQRRIEQGVASGELTNREAARLERGQARDNAAQARAGADGKVGPNEQRRLQRQENRQSRRIYREKHDAQQRP
ncbi:MAG: hypothetical protein E6H44_01820 [Betaproteobacteria bacterium]|nr:MAG: hypothetical protein E6H44_01820 [Betaproteobacteria bacterium]TMI05057.1 MAG: hypothetical protein E6H43_00950 [Betaproteobacteria bacterium]TMI12364.1 MAG: hypothetical protein E6H40_02155 [Betaproteobacteria bacterium]